tara:strand:+ start:2074 stop:3084 length:1011 start_codon:yes stop_codon:yes gene_type:complete
MKNPKILEEISLNRKNDLVNPLVSICCVTYNQCAYISQTLDGILMQKTNFSYEICLGEDGSMDGTKEICQKYAEKNSDRIRLFERSRKDVIFINNKPTGKFNFYETLKESKGKYIAVCEGDDYWTDPYKLQKQIDFLEGNNEYDMVHTNFSTLKNGIIKNRPDKVSSIKDVKNQLLIKNFIGTLTICVKKNVLLDACANISSNYLSVDLAIAMQISQKSKIGYLKDNTAVYRISNNTASNSTSAYDQLFFIRTAFQMKNDFINKYQYSQTAINKLNHRWCRVLFKYYIKLGDSAIKFELNKFIQDRKKKSLWIYKFILLISRLDLTRKMLKKLWSN